jgi:Stf0 sulfotransferase
MNESKHCVFVISDTRTGSTALSDALAYSLDVPSMGEIFHNISNSAVLNDQLNVITELFGQLTPNYGFVAKIMYHDLLLGQGIKFRLGGLAFVIAEAARRFPGAVFIHLIRRDTIAAAYSEHRAVATGCYHVKEGIDSKRSKHHHNFQVSDDEMEEILLQSKERAASYRMVREWFRGSGLRILELDHANIANGSAQGLLQLHFGPIPPLVLKFKKIVRPAELNANFKP